MPRFHRKNGDDFILSLYFTAIPSVRFAIALPKITQALNYQFAAQTTHHHLEHFLRQIPAKIVEPVLIPAFVLVLCFPICVKALHEEL